MQTLDVKYTDRIHGFQGRLLKIVTKAQLKVELGRNAAVRDADWKTRCALIKLTRRHHECTCGARDVSASFRRTRYVQGEPLGELQTFYEVDMHLLACNVCGKTWYESLPFLSHPMSRITKSFAKLMIRFRESMSITDVARNFGVDWRCVKDAEKEHLALKYRNNSLKGVTAITIDEMYLFPHERPSRKYVTIVRDAVTGRVLSVTRGKGANALRQFAWRLRRYKGKIRYVCIDMSQAHSAWVAENLPKAKAVFDHFHLIKAMIEKMDHVRRREMAKLDYEAKRTIKGHRFVFMRNEENLDAKGLRILGELRESNLQLADAHMLKEQLRRVYTFCETRYDAKSALEDWCQAARASGIFEMCQMANMVEKHLEGILGYWDFGHANSGSAEGFNTKVRLLMKQSYGLRDFKYLKLKIMDLPSRKIRVSI